MEHKIDLDDLVRQWLDDDQANIIKISITQEDGSDVVTVVTG